LDTKDGISLLSLKHNLLLSYLQSLTLVMTRRAMGYSLDSRSPPELPFSSADREPRGSGTGDLVDSMIETRIVLEKIKTLEGRMRYQIEKLVNLAHETPSSNQKTIDGTYGSDAQLSNSETHSSRYEQTLCHSAPTPKI
jgi:U3 small nucleolar ribonucleoprotein protein LCP5